MNVTIHKQKPSPRKTGVSGQLAVHDKQAWLFSNDIPVMQLDRPEIIFVNQDGMMLRGFEPAGYTKSGVQRWSYQEWYCRYWEVVR